MMDDLLTTRIRYVTRTPLESYTKEFEKKAQEERKLYIDVVEKSVNDIINDEVKSLLPQILPKEVSDFATPVIHSTITKSLENVVLAKSSSQPQSTYETAASLTESREDKDKDEDPPTRLDQGLKKKRHTRMLNHQEALKEPVFETIDTEMPQDQGDDMCNTEDQPNVEATPRNDYRIAQAEKTPLTFDELMSTPIDFSAYAMHNLKINNLKHEILIGPAFNLLKGTCKSFVELEYHFEECYKAITDKLDWNNPEGHEYPFDLSKPLPLIEAQGHLVEHADYFFNNDLEYLKGGSSSWKYTTSTTKNKATKYYNIEGIEDMVPTLWSLVKKLSNLEKDVIFDLNVALSMFTRRIVILKRVEDLELGVKSYQKKLNITKPETFRFDISKRTPYTAYKNPQGVIYQDKLKINTLMHSDELYKFCDSTLSSVQRDLYDIASILEMDYLPKRRWSNLDRKRSRIMIKAIDQQLFERRLMRNLEKFVRGREYENDFRLFEQTI
ncbi:hypothetical protein Tco_0913363 [Tanacetum coccineum]